MKITFAHRDQRTILFYFFVTIGPLAAKFDGCFNRLHARIHREEFVVSEVVACELLVRPEFVVIKGAAGQRQSLCLLGQRLNDRRMTMSLVEGRITT